MSRVATSHESAQEHRVALVAKRRALQVSVAALGIALIVAALAATQSWWDSHFLPIFALDRATLVTAEQTLRALVALSGILCLVFHRPLAGVLSRATAGDALRGLLAAVLALGAGELILRVHPLQPRCADPMEQEPKRRIDPQLGWIFVPGRSVSVEEAGRRLSYTFDAAGYRVSTPGVAVDIQQPTLVFTGESIIAGYGLPWQETIPARVSTLLGIQSANLAVFDYSNDQSYLRLAAELPRFRKPAAVLTLFMPSLFEKNLLEDRPHLGPGLRWQPADQHWRLGTLLHWLFPYRTRSAIERGIVHTRDSLRAFVDLAHARGATPLIVVPQLGPESAPEAMLRQRILDAENLPYIQVRLDASWHLPGDRHPDTRGAQAIASAIAARLRGD